MSTVQINNSVCTSALHEILVADDIVPGDPVGYETCKLLYLWHPVGLKAVEAPITMAQSQRREITVPSGPEEMLRDAFEREWKKLDCDAIIFDVTRLKRIYGVSSLTMLERGRPTDEAVDFENLYRADVSFNRLDPLNTAGSFVFNQDPNALDFNKLSGMSVNGQPYHRSRYVVSQNEAPIYISYTASSYGYTGRSVYQRALFPLKSFLQTMITDDMVAVKAGVLVAKMKQPGSVVDAVMQKMAGVKRNLLREAVVGNVLGIGQDDTIESLNFQNLDGPMAMARKNILNNIALGLDMPAIILSGESFADGLSDGTEDSKNVARYVQRMRIEMNPLYDFMDRVVQHRAWNPEYYRDVVQKKFPNEYGEKPYRTAFYEWQNSFEARWPSLLEEPDSEKSKIDKVKLEGLISLVETLMPGADPENKAEIYRFVADNVNSMKNLFTTPLDLDYETLANQPAPAQPQEGTAPMSLKDSANLRSLLRLVKDGQERVSPADHLRRVE